MTSDKMFFDLAVAAIQGLTATDKQGAYQDRSVEDCERIAKDAVRIASHAYREITKYMDES